MTKIGNIELGEFPLSLTSSMGASNKGKSPNSMLPIFVIRYFLTQRFVNSHPLVINSLQRYQK